VNVIEKWVIPPLINKSIWNFKCLSYGRCLEWWKFVKNFFGGFLLLTRGRLEDSSVINGKPRTWNIKLSSCITKILIPVRNRRSEFPISINLFFKKILLASSTDCATFDKKYIKRKKRDDRETCFCKSSWNRKFPETTASRQLSLSG